jgi:hypothetical protein
MTDETFEAIQKEIKKEQALKRQELIIDGIRKQRDEALKSLDVLKKKWYVRLFE